MLPETIRRRSLLKAALGGTGALLGGAAAGFSAAAMAQSPARPSALAITSVETFPLRHKMRRAMGVSTALSDVRQCLLVKISTDSGLVGWGETTDVGGTRGVVETHLKPKLLGKNPLHHRELWRSLWGPSFGDGRAVAAVDIALHDLRGKALGQSIAEMYGGRLRDRVLAYASAMNYTDGVRPEDQFPAEAAELVRRGYKALKIRTGRFESRRDLAVLAKIRETVGPEIRLLTDGNGAFTLPQAVKFGKELEKLDFYCFEEPLPQGLSYAGYDVLTQSLDIAIAGGEGLDSRVAARDHIVRRSFDIIQPDVVLCGGIGEALFIAEMARLWSVQCLPHCWSGAIGIAATLQLLSLLPAATFGFTSDEPLLEHDTLDNPFREELSPQPFRVNAAGYIEIPQGPGLGIEVDESIVKKYLADRRGD
jgi:D-galactarolactone cycloisomerase